MDGAEGGRGDASEAEQRGRSQRAWGHEAEAKAAAGDGLGAMAVIRSGENEAGAMWWRPGGAASCGYHGVGWAPVHIRERGESREITTVPRSLVWELVKKSKCFLIKQFGNSNAKVQFHKDPTTSTMSATTSSQVHSSSHLHCSWRAQSCLLVSLQSANLLWSDVVF